MKYDKEVTTQQSCGDILVSIHLSVCLSVPRAMSALWLIACLMDYIHMWQYNPWGDDVLHTISRSIGQRSRSLTVRSNFCSWVVITDLKFLFVLILININVENINVDRPQHFMYIIHIG